MFGVLVALVTVLGQVDATSPPTPTFTPTVSPSMSPSSTPTLRPSTEAPTTSPPTSVPTFIFDPICRPSFRTTARQCQRLIKRCANRAPMKWTGKGCRALDGRALGDGGCQCKSYCGYSCEKSCKKDPECYWGDDSCNVLATRKRGIPLPFCSLVTSL